MQLVELVACTYVRFCIIVPYEIKRNRQNEKYIFVNCYNFSFLFTCRKQFALGKINIMAVAHKLAFRALYRFFIYFISFTMFLNIILLFNKDSSL